MHRPSLGNCMLFCYSCKEKAEIVVSPREQTDPGVGKLTACGTAYANLHLHAHTLSRLPDHLWISLDQQQLFCQHKCKVNQGMVWFGGQDHGASFGCQINPVPLLFPPQNALPYPQPTNNSLSPTASRNCTMPLTVWGNGRAVHKSGAMHRRHISSGSTESPQDWAVSFVLPFLNIWISPPLFRPRPPYRF